MEAMTNLHKKIQSGAKATLTADDRVASIDWNRTARELATYGAAVHPSLLATEECREIAALYSDDSKFRSHIVMARHGFGKGEYKYFAYPLPDLIGNLRAALYSYLAPVANEWNSRMNIDMRYPAKHKDFVKLCHEAGQERPTPLLLQYVAGDFNALHQDLYGDLAFPLQVAFLLSEPGKDFTGGEFVLTEQRPRMQSRAEVVSLHQGDAVVFAVHHRPVDGARGTYRVNLRHGVSRVRSGRRHTLGIIFQHATAQGTHACGRRGAGTDTCWLHGHHHAAAKHLGLPKWFARDHGNHAGIRGPARHLPAN
jgi:hypothetical protein